MNPRQKLELLIEQDRAALLTARAELESHLRDCVTCNSDKPSCSMAQELISAATELEVRVEVLEQKLPDDMPGMCRECGCTDDRACSPPCSWVDEKHTLCSSCYAKERAS